MSGYREDTGGGSKLPALLVTLAIVLIVVGALWYNGSLTGLFHGK